MAFLLARNNVRLVMGKGGIKMIEDIIEEAEGWKIFCRDNKGRGRTGLNDTVEVFGDELIKFCNQVIHELKRIQKAKESL